VNAALQTVAEPDEADWSDEATGYACRIVRHPRAKHLCGYVQVPEGHPLHGLSYSADLPEALAPLADAVLHGPIGKRGAIEVFCIAAGGGKLDVGGLFDVHGSITFSGDLLGRDGHWFGFDCAHSGDLSPGYDYGDGVYRTFEYVKAECASLAKQLQQVAA